MTHQRGEDGYHAPEIETDLSEHQSAWMTAQGGILMKAHTPTKPMEAPAPRSEVYAEIEAQV